MTNEELVRKIAKKLWHDGETNIPDIINLLDSHVSAKDEALKIRDKEIDEVNQLLKVSLAHMENQSKDNVSKDKRIAELEKALGVFSDIFDKECYNDDDIHDVKMNFTKETIKRLYGASQTLKQGA